MLGHEVCRFFGAGGTERSRAAFWCSFPGFSRSFLVLVADAAVWAGRWEDQLTSAAAARAGGKRTSVGWRRRQGCLEEADGWVAVCGRLLVADGGMD